MFFVCLWVCFEMLFEGEECVVVLEEVEWLFGIFDMIMWVVCIEVG